MNKIYLTLCALTLSLLSFAQNGQIQNGGFENWTDNVLYQFLADWNDSNSDQWQGVSLVNQSTDATLGTYSVEISSAEAGPNPDTLFGYFYHGTTGQSGPDGGIPYTSDFDEVRYQYKSDITAGDTAYLIYIRFDAGGNMLDMGVLPAAFGTNSTWTQGSISVPVISQASLFIGMVMGDPFSGIAPAPNAWARFDDLQIHNSGVETTAVPNPSFENWSQASVEEPDNWYTLNSIFAGMGIQNAIKTIDANSGTYAIEMTTIQEPNNGDTISSFVSMGPINVMGGNPFELSPYTASPTTFSGAYKYSPVNGDQGGIQIQFFQGGGQVGMHMENFTSAGAYTTFSSPITLSGAPDSILFIIYSGDNPGSVLKVDDLAFFGGDVGITEFENMNVSIYPNPASEILMVKADGEYHVTIIDLTGKSHLQQFNMIGSNELDISSLSSGTYIVQISNNNEVENHKVIVH